MNQIFRFGFAITNLGDLNKDGYDDIAIGAPYEGNGVIYIYQGSDLGIVVEPSQVSSIFSILNYNTLFYRICI
jgi:integrin alpha 7